MLLWTNDNLPWVRGKCLMQGLRLPEMDACDALDVIHVLLEEDNSMLPDQQKEKERVRDAIYREIYGQPRKFSPAAVGASSAPRTGPTSADGQPVKPYIPPTDDAQLTGIVGSPLG